MRERIFKTVWELKKEGHAESTIEGYGNKLKILSKDADLNCPEAVRTVIAEKNCSVAYKEARDKTLSAGQMVHLATLAVLIVSSEII